jgi:hypothetical protein
MAFCPFFMGFFSTSTSFHTDKTFKMLLSPHWYSATSQKDLVNTTQKLFETRRRARWALRRSSVGCFDDRPVSVGSTKMIKITARTASQAKTSPSPGLKHFLGQEFGHLPRFPADGQAGKPPKSVETPRKTATAPPARSQVAHAVAKWHVARFSWVFSVPPPAFTPIKPSNSI